MTMPPTDAPKVSSSKKGTRKTKFLVLGCVLVFCCLVSVLLVGMVVAFFSNKNIPVFSDAVETAENIAVSDKKQAELVQEDIRDTVFSFLPVSGEDGLTTSYINATYTKSDLESMISEKEEFDSVRYNLAMSVDMEEKGKFEVNAKGASKKEGDGSNMNAIIDGKFTMEGATLDGAGEIRTVEGKSYLKLDKFPALGLMDFSQLRGIWLQTEATEAQGLAGGLLPVPSSEDSATMTKEDLKKIEEVIMSDEVNKNIKRLDDEVIEGVRTQCFRLDMDRNDLKDLIVRANDVFDGEDLDIEALEQDLQSVEYVKIDMCSGRGDGHLYRLGLDMKVMDNNEPMVVKMDLKMWDYDKVNDKIEAPSNPQKLEDVLMQLQSSGM